MSVQALQHLSLMKRMLVGKALKFMTIGSLAQPCTLSDISKPHKTLPNIVKWAKEYKKDTFGYYEFLTGQRPPLRHRSCYVFTGAIIQKNRFPTFGECVQSVWSAWAFFFNSYESFRPEVVKPSNQDAVNRTFFVEAEWYVQSVCTRL